MAYAYWPTHATDSEPRPGMMIYDDTKMTMTMTSQ